MKTKINLLPELVANRRREAAIRQQGLVALIAWVLVVALATGGTVAFAGFNSYLQSRAQNTERNLNSQVNSPSRVAARTEAQSVQSTLATLSGLYANDAHLSAVVDALTFLTPAGVVYKNVDFTVDQKVDISGKAATYMDVAKLEAALKNSAKTQANTSGSTSSAGPYFTAVSLGGTSVNENLISFTMSANYVSGGGPTK